MRNHSIKRYRLSVITMLAFTTIIFMTIIHLQLNSETVQKAIRNVKMDELFIQIIKSENHLYFPTHESNFLSLESISELFFQVAVNIKPKDARTFILTEVPGLIFYDTEIVVAGEGTNLSTLPYESPPPPEVLLNEKKVAEDRLNEDFSQSGQITSEPQGDPNVFIYHTHNIESFLPLLEGAAKPNEAISSDERANIVAVGSRLSNALLQKGISVEHDKTNINKELLNRDMKYSAAYNISKEVLEAASANNPNLEYYIDIHRDSARKDVTTKTIRGEDYAKVYFVVGKENKHYEKNLQFVKKLNERLEQKYPGISRGIMSKGKHEGNGVYNQNISERAILLEVGGVDNTLDELARTTDAFAEIFAEIYWEEKGVKGK